VVQAVGEEAAVTKTQETPVERSPEFEALVLEHMDMMYAVALRLTHNAADAQDLTQNTVVKALRFHEKFERGTYIKAWLLTILRNTFINEYRRKVRRPAHVELSGMEAAKDDHPDPGVNFTPQSRQPEELMELLDDRVKDAVLALPEDFKQAVIMADIQDMSYKEIAERMDCPLGTVMSRLFRGRKLLREKLADYAAEMRIIPKETVDTPRQGKRGAQAKASTGNNGTGGSLGM
jgi:RNA polymerase sigma-70 factor (ECF subfamily)